MKLCMQYIMYLFECYKRVALQCRFVSIHMVLTSESLYYLYDV